MLSFASRIKDYKVIIDGRNIFDQPVNNNLITCEVIRQNIYPCSTAIILKW